MGVSLLVDKAADDDTSGSAVPETVTRRLGDRKDSAEVRRVGVELATSLCDELLAGAAPGLHFSTLQLLKRDAGNLPQSRCPALTAARTVEAAHRRIFVCWTG